MSPENDVNAKRKKISDFAKKLNGLRKSVPIGYAKQDFNQMKLLLKASRGWELLNPKKDIEDIILAIENNLSSSREQLAEREFNTVCEFSSIFRRDVK